ncbi:hypothetical protein [Microcella sp.]|uniref:hypothetical protein n=1 Tax=Microcella sp. TaxID=1913979 RepID=UPI00299F853F|nr:hypothetical protein [Microcella sp.]MDX2026040.1 hypothetical protein [Microcella sp.]
MDQFTVVLLVMAGIIVVLVLGVGRRGDDSGVLRLLGALAMTWAAISLLGVVALVSLTLLGDQSLELSLVSATILSEAPAVAGVAILPGTSRVVVDPSTLSPVAVAVTLVGTSIVGIVSAIVAGVIAFALRRIAAGDPFPRSMYRATLLAGSALTLGLPIGAAIMGFARTVVADELNTLVGEERFRLGFEFDLTPALIGVVVLALAEVFRVGERLQNDTKGLV